jgi:hypothetical protein
MRGENGSYFLDAVNQRAGKIPLFHAWLYFRNDRAPEILSAFGLYSGVAHDSKFMRDRSNEYQNGIMQSGLVHFQLCETLPGAPKRIVGFMMAHEDPDLAARMSFGFPDGRNDFVMVDCFDKMAGFHSEL